MDAVDLAQYLPPYAQVQLLRESGAKYAKYTLQASPTPVDSLYYSHMDLGKSGSPYTWIKDYWKADSWCRATYAVLFLGDDASVTETGDWTTSNAPCSPNTLLGYKTPAGASTGLTWAPVGGLTDAAAVNDMNIWRQNNPGAAYLNSGKQAYSKVGLIEQLESYTPPYGRDSDGVWRAGGSKTYYNVIHIVMYHGTKDAASSPVRCDGPISAKGAYYQSRGNYNSYAIELWLAAGVGIIQENTPFIESGAYWGIPNCNGNIFVSPGAWYSYIDQQ